MKVTTWIHFLVLGVVFPLNNVWAQARYWSPPAASRWQLGVAVDNIPHGCQVTRVAPGSAASQAGIEVGDLLLVVSNTPVGLVNGQIYDLTDVINSQADLNGRISLTFRAARSGQLLTVPVQLSPAFNGQLPRPPIGNLPRPPIVNRPVYPVQPIAPPADNVSATIRDWYLTYLGREPEPTAFYAWVDQVNRGVPLGEVRIGILSSSEYYDRCQNNPSVYVQSLYNQAVGRQPSGRELNTWVTLFNGTFRGDRLRFCRTFLERVGQ